MDDNSGVTHIEYFGRKDHPCSLSSYDNTIMWTTKIFMGVELILIFRLPGFYILYLRVANVG